MLILKLDRTQEEPKHWAAWLPGNVGLREQALFAQDQLDPQAQEEALTHVISESARGVNLVALAITWTTAEGVFRQARLGVCAESAEALLPPHEFQELTADAIIECLISGKSPAAWYDQRLNLKASSNANDAAIESLRSVDTAGYLLYRVRRFGRAINEMGRRILPVQQDSQTKPTVPRCDALRYRLFQDPFGPLSLAGKIAKASAGTNDGFGQLEPEHRIFLLAEILLVVTHLRKYIEQVTGARRAEELLAPFRESERQLEALIADIQVASVNAVPPNLAEYLDAVRGAFPSAEQPVSRDQ